MTKLSDIFTVAKSYASERLSDAKDKAAELKQKAEHKLDRLAADRLEKRGVIVTKTKSSSWNI